MTALANQYTQHSKFPYYKPSLLSSLTSLFFSFLFLFASFQSYIASKSLHMLFQYMDCSFSFFKYLPKTSGKSSVTL